MNRRRTCRFAIAAVTAVALAILLLPSVALAEPVLIGTSRTNPNGGDSAWRGGWGNSLYPEYTFDATATNGFYYMVERTPHSIIETGSLESYLRATLPDGTHMTHTLDIPGTYAFPPPGGWPQWEPGMRNPLEGHWFFNFIGFSEETSSGAITWLPQLSLPAYIDLTPPAPVHGVRVSPHPSVPSSTSVVAPTSRVTVRWDGADTDALSGTAFYSLYMDGQTLLSGGPDGTNTTPGVSPFWYNPNTRLPYTVTIEDLDPGRHVFEMTCTDRALNESGKSAVAVFYSDPDTPTITLISPATGMLPKTATLSVIATDLAGIQDVTFVLDNTLLGVVSGPADEASHRYDLKYDFAGFANGTHTLQVSARDMYGRVVTVTKVVTLDKVVPAITSVSHAPNPFCPILRDGYKDNAVVTFTVSEKATMSLYIYDANKKLVQTLTAVRNAGRSSFIWNGKKANGTVSAGRYYYVVAAVDGAGNSNRTGYIATRIISYELRKTASNRVVVIPR